MNTDFVLLLFVENQPSPFPSYSNGFGKGEEVSRKFPIPPPPKARDKGRQKCRMQWRPDLLTTVQDNFFTGKIADRVRAFFR